MAPSAYIPQFLRQLVTERAQFRREYCQLQQELCPDTFEVDHIIPRALEGKTEPDNLCYACPVCNNAKRSQITAQDPRTGQRVRLSTLDDRVGIVTFSGVPMAGASLAKRS